jgi:hypothetical protein
VRNGGISKAYLGSKFFDPSLIEPIKKKSLSCTLFVIFIDIPLNIQQNSSYVPESKQPN